MRKFEGSSRGNWLRLFGTSMQCSLICQTILCPRGCTLCTNIMGAEPYKKVASSLTIGEEKGRSCNRAIKATKARKYNRWYIVISDEETRPLGKAFRERKVIGEYWRVEAREESKAEVAHCQSTLNTINLRTYDSRM